ncbi:unnamed protein product [Amoebophrya sp. A25]|nr:unnamed protein product [Amoebophrya sp. A25]|eukprot:GSA25T00021003001.1
MPMSLLEAVLRRKKQQDRGKKVESAASIVLRNAASSAASSTSQRGSVSQRAQFLERYFDDSDALKAEGADRGWLHVTTLILKEQLDQQLAQLVQKHSVVDLLYRSEGDGTSRTVLEVGEAGREVWRGSKWIVVENTVSWRAAGGEERGLVQLPAETVLFAPKKAQEIQAAADEEAARAGRGISGDHAVQVPIPNELTEAADVADVIFSVTNIDELLSKIPLEKLFCFLFYSDSGGSTQNTQLWMGKHWVDGTIRNAKRGIFWTGRCRIHQGAIIARECNDLLLACTGINPRVWEKRVHLAIKTMSIKRQDISTGLSSWMNNYLEEVRGARPPEKLDALLRLFRVPDATLEVLKSLYMPIDEEEAFIFCTPGNAKKVRTSIHRLTAGFRAPSWSRWTTFVTEMGKFLLCVLFYVHLVVGRLYGDQVKLKDETCTNNIKGASRQKDDSFLLYVSGYFEYIIGQPVEHYLKTELKKQPRNRTEVRTALENDVNGVLLRLQDIESTLKELKLLIHVNLSEEQEATVYMFCVSAELAVRAAEVQFSWRFGTHKDIHEAFMERYIAGQEDLESLMSFDASEIHDSDPGYYCLASLQQYLQQFSDVNTRKRMLRRFMQMIHQEKRRNKGVETKVQRVKRKAKVGVGHRAMKNIVAYQMRSDFNASLNRVQADALQAEMIKEPPRSKRYCYRRSIDIFKSKLWKLKLGEKGKKGEKTVLEKGCNSVTLADMGLVEEALQEEALARLDGGASAIGSTTASSSTHDNTKDNQEDHDPVRDPLCAKQEHEFFTGLKKRVETDLEKSVLYKSAAEKNLEGLCRRWLQKIKYHPSEIRVSPRLVHRIERQVCSACRAARKKISERSTDSLELGVDEADADREEAVDEVDEEDDRIDDETADAPPTVFLLVFHLPVDGASASSCIDNTTKVSMLTMRIDLKCSDFSGVWVEKPNPLQEDRYVATRDIVHSVPLLKEEQFMNSSVKIYKAKIYGEVVDKKLMLRVQRGAEVVVNSRKGKATTTTISGTNTSDNSLLSRMLREGKRLAIKRQHEQDRPAGEVKHKRRKVVEEASSSTSKKDIIDKAVAIDEEVDLKAKMQKEAFINAVGNKSPGKSMKGMYSSMTLGKDKVQDLETAKSIINEWLCNVQIEGMKIADASSQTTFKMRGRLTDTLRVAVDSTRRLRFLQIIRDTSIDIMSTAKSSAHRKFNYPEDEWMHVSYLCALWALRARFICDRAGKFLADSRYKCRDPARLAEEYEEYIADCVHHGRNSWKHLKGENAKSMQRAMRLCDESLAVLEVGREEFEFDDFPDHPE